MDKKIKKNVRLKIDQSSLYKVILNTCILYLPNNVLLGEARVITQVVTTTLISKIFEPNGNVVTVDEAQYMTDIAEDNIKLILSNICNQYLSDDITISSMKRLMTTMTNIIMRPINYGEPIRSQ